LYQRANQKQRQVEVSQAKRIAIEPALSTAGKRTLTQEQTYGAPDLYTRAIQSARRDLRAVRTTVLPLFIKTLRDKTLEPLTMQTQLATVAMQVRHLLMTANQHVNALEKAAPYRDPMVLFLRHDVDTLAARAGKLGVYRGAEDMIPRRHVDETKQVLSRGEAAQRVRKPSAATQRLQAIAKLNRPPPRMARGTAPAMRVSTPSCDRGEVRAENARKELAPRIEGTPATR
jgi:hypothetical protein